VIEHQHTPRSPLRVVLAGGTGQIGQTLAPAFAAEGHDVVILSRNPAPGGYRSVEWDAKTLGGWTREIDGADVVVNLAGRSVDCRYNEANRRAIMESRVDSTTALGKAIAQADDPPPLWLQSSTATIYAHTYDAPNDEATGILGGDEPDVPDTWRFSIDVAKAWEDAALPFETDRTRVVLMRSAMVLAPTRGGVFDVLLKLARRRLAGPVAGGRQFFSWIHHDDFTRSLLWLIDHEDVRGAVNIASPNPLPQGEFMRRLRDAAGVRVGLPATRWMAEIGAWAMRTETELIFKSRRVVPGRLMERGFSFHHPTWPETARDLVEARRTADVLKVR
jgi:uncharacterized protein (TIGR01777 family)